MSRLSLKLSSSKTPPSGGGRYKTFVSWSSYLEWAGHVTPVCYVRWCVNAKKKPNFIKWIFNFDTPLNPTASSPFELGLLAVRTNTKVGAINDLWEESFGGWVWRLSRLVFVSSGADAYNQLMWESGIKGSGEDWAQHHRALQVIQAGVTALSSHRDSGDTQPADQRRSAFPQAPWPPSGWACMGACTRVTERRVPSEVMKAHTYNGINAARYTSVRVSFVLWSSIGLGSMTEL